MKIVIVDTMEPNVHCQLTIIGQGYRLGLDICPCPAGRLIDEVVAAGSWPGGQSTREDHASRSFTPSILPLAR
jgi:hypothetical protein